MSKTEENFKKYQAMIVSRGYDKLIPDKNLPTDLNDLCRKLAMEGQELLDREELTKCNKSLPITSTPSKNLENALASKDTNPYVRARGQVLKDLPKDRRERIEEMEKSGKIDNGIYQEFIRMVRILGDQFSNNS
jgi:hypothetical protein